MAELTRTKRQWRTLVIRNGLGGAVIGAAAAGTLVSVTGGIRRTIGEWLPVVGPGAIAYTAVAVGILVAGITGLLTRPRPVPATKPQEAVGSGGYGDLWDGPARDDASSDVHRDSEEAEVSTPKPVPAVRIRRLPPPKQGAEQRKLIPIESPGQHEGEGFGFHGLFMDERGVVVIPDE